MKHLKHFLLTMLIAFVSSVSAFAYDFEVDGIYYNVLSEDDRTCEVTEGDISYTGDVVIPSSAFYSGKKYKVIKIGDYAFDHCYYGLRTVTIPNTVIEIGERAFQVNYDLSSVNIPTSVNKIGSYAFLFCSSLSSVSIPNSVTEIGISAFSRSGIMTPVYNNTVFAYLPENYVGNYSIPDGITKIAGGAFFDCTDLNSVTMPNTIIEIGDESFGYCGNLTSVTMSNSLKEIGEYAFEGCYSLTSLTIPNSVTEIGDYAFMNCDGITAPLYNKTIFAMLPQSYVGEYNIPDGLLKISGTAFSFCRDLSSVKIPNSITEIGVAAFLNCISLTSMTLPESITEIGDYAFRYCSNLYEINSEGNIPPTCGNYVFDEICTEGVLKVPSKSLDLYKNTAPWSEFENIVGISSIKPSVVYNGDGVAVSVTDWDEAESMATAANALIFAEGTDDDLPQNVVCDGKAAKIALTDAEPFYCPTNVEAETLSYTRNFSGDFWQALYIPFDMSFEEWNGVATVAYFNDVHQYDTNGDGEPDKTTIEFFTQKSGSVRPNIPYMIKPRKTGEVTFVCSNKTLAATPDESEPGFVDCTSTSKYYKISGNYQTKADMYSGGYYAVASDGNFKQAGSAAVKLAPFRVYLGISDRMGAGTRAGAGIAALENIILVIDGEEIGRAEEILAPEMIYDLMGRRVDNQSAHGGMFIKNGKKIMVK